MPSEQVLLLTDVVDSTRLNQQLGDAAMGLIWEQHDRAARDLMQTWDGREIGRADGFLIMFDSTVHAVNFAVAYHRVLRAFDAPLLARVGLHVGPVSLRENSATDRAKGAPSVEIDGVALPVASRIMAAAIGGQTLLSEAARHALGATPHRLQSHGHWRLKGLDVPIELFEVGEPDAPWCPPPDSPKAYRVAQINGAWTVASEIRNSLPSERDQFVGRTIQLNDLARRFDRGARLVCVLGIGGVGKTRLAVRFGWSWMGDFPGGVWFCDLSQAKTLDGVAHATAKGLEMTLGGADPIEQIGRAIAGRNRCLVILDNFEQVAHLAGDTLGAWLDRTREAVFLVATREVLGLPGEEVSTLAPLSVGEATLLFEHRAAAALTEFRHTPDDVQAIEPLVRLLDGLPLAIELAAVRVRVMPPSMLLRRMGERFDLLAVGGRRQGRQSTLRRAFDWSWDLMTTMEKGALAQLSVFEGGFTLSAAQAVLQLSTKVVSMEAVNVVQSLIEKSMIRHIGAHRFGMLQSVQEYAIEHLSTPGRFDGSGPEALVRATSRHYKFFAVLDERAALADGCVELDNIVAACRRAVARGDATSATGALTNAWIALRMTGPFKTAADLAALVGGLPGLPEPERAIVDWVNGSVAYLLGDAAHALASLESALAASRTFQLAPLQVRLLCALGELHMTAGRPSEAGESLNEAMRVAVELNDPALECRALNGLGALAIDLAHLEEARSLYERALALARQVGDQRWEGGLLSNLGAIHYQDGRIREAQAHYEQALALVLSVGDRRWEGSARCNLGLLQHEQGRHADAREQFESALALATEMGLSRLESSVLCNLGIVTEALDELEPSKQYLERAVSSSAALNDPRSEGQFRGYLGQTYARLNRFADARDCLDKGESLLASSHDPLSLGLLLCSRARAEHLAQDRGAALSCFERAQAIWLESGSNSLSELGRAIEKLRPALAGPAELAPTSR